MTMDEALRFLADAAKIKHSEKLMIPEFVEHNERVREAANVLARGLGINLHYPTQGQQ
jgi:hypothetical protein